MVYSAIAEIRSKFDHFGPQVGRWPRNGPFPLKNGFFLVYSAIAEIRSKFDHCGPQKGRWARNGPFPLKNGFFLVYSTIAEIRDKFQLRLSLTSTAFILSEPR